MTNVTRRVADFAGLEVPVIEITGDAPGPRLSVISGVHGCEYASMAGVRRWVAGLTGDPGRPLRGSVTVVPVVNLPAFWARTPFRRPRGRQEPQPVLSRGAGRDARGAAGVRRVRAGDHRQRRVRRRACR